MLRCTAWQQAETTWKQTGKEIINKGLYLEIISSGSKTYDCLKAHKLVSKIVFFVMKSPAIVLRVLIKPLVSSTLPFIIRRSVFIDGERHKSSKSQMFIYLKSFILCLYCPYDHR